LLDSEIGIAAVHGLKLVACAVVADAVFGMAIKLCPDFRRKVIAVLVLAALIVIPSTNVQLIMIVLAGIAGAAFVRDVSTSDQVLPMSVPYGQRLGIIFICLFFVLLVFLPLLGTEKPDAISVAGSFYQAGALVFGGGHVVLPLLEDSVVSTGWLTSEAFLAGYGASQAIPGPMFAFSAYLGALLSQDAVLYMAAVALGFMFLPGFLLILGVLPFWQSVSKKPAITRAIAGINAGVVGLLVAALYDPILTSGMTNLNDVLIVLVAIGLLTVLRLSPLVVVVWCVLASVSILWLTA
jgi:chromate transporter